MGVRQRKEESSKGISSSSHCVPAQERGVIERQRLRDRNIGAWGFPLVAARAKSEGFGGEGCV